ncbi:MAG: hypothetical protein AAFQ47_15640 [Pseudomonadota bacterium]
MSSQENKLLIKIGKHFEANASGTLAVAAVFAIVIALLTVGFSFL